MRPRVGGLTREVTDTMAGEQDGRAVRRRILTDGLAIVLSLFAFGMVFGLAARQADFSLVEALSMSLIAYSGAAQFAAVGLVAASVPWLGIVVLTALLNARHVLYCGLARAMVRRDLPTPGARWRPTS